GPGEGKAGLHLTDQDAATVTLPSGERAIVPGRPDESELLRRVASADPEVRMPPKGPPLSAGEVAKLRRWIAAGAVWPAHWAYRPLAKPVLPRLVSSSYDQWPRTPIDRFILQELLARQLSPAPA